MGAPAEDIEHLRPDAAEGGDAARAVPRESDSGQCPLPPGLPYFAGRRRELDGLRADIDRPGLEALRGRVPAGCRVLLVAGRPGSGRTTLAVRLAREVAERYPDGRFFLRLTDSDGERLPDGQAARAMLRAMGAAPEPGAGPEKLRAALRSAFAARRAVLVLDDVAHPEQLLALLPDGPGNLVIATSGGPLPGVPDVRPCTVGGLDSAASIDLLTHLVGAIRITNDPRAAEALAGQCAGDPTALRLMGAWLAAHPRLAVADALHRLRAVLDVTAVERPDRPVRSAGGGTGEPRSGASAPLARAFMAVYEALPQTAARLLRLLVLAPAGLADAQIASALAGCSVDAARGALEDLAACGLLEREPGTATLPHLYRVPGCLAPLLRALVETRDRPAEVALARARMLERTVRLLHACRLGLAPDQSDEVPRPLRFASRAAAAEWLRARLPALLAAARSAVADGELDTLARRLVAALVRALAADPECGDTTAERYQLHCLVLDVAERRGLPRERAAALINLGDLEAESARPAEALEHYRAALVAAREGFDGDAEGRALEAIAGTYLELDDPQRASDWFGRALALRQTRGELVHEARLRGRIGALHIYAGRYGSALKEWRAVVAAHRRLQDLPAQARALSEVARVQEYAGHPEDSLRTCRDALYWARQAGERRLEGAVLLRMADTLDRLGDPAGARLQRAAADHLLQTDE
ncbi:tetratricopeptide repeat protein [Actinacidiphila oryziradicis]|uniref:tetratricopeptide repeat protein n=1 Tax=Actinacidiphila oryziradicis TaxID=2571141 RepID=UPI00389913BF